MANSGKVGTLILIVLLVFSMGVGGWLYYNLDQQSAKNQEQAATIETLQLDKKKAESEMLKYQKLNSEVQLKVADMQKKIDELSLAVEQEKQSKKSVMADMDSLKEKLEEQIKKRELLEKKFDYAQDNVKKLQEKLVELNKKAEKTRESAVEDKAKEQNVELGKIVVNPEPAASAPAAVVEKKEVSNPPAAAQQGAMEGKVLVVNKDYNFIVINLGNKDGINLGDVFSVYHGNKFIGDVKVEKLHEAMAAAGFMTAETKDKVGEGDKVISKGK